MAHCNQPSISHRFWDLTLQAEKRGFTYNIAHPSSQPNLTKLPFEFSDDDMIRVAEGLPYRLTDRRQTDGEQYRATHVRASRGKNYHRAQAAPLRGR